MSQIVSVLLIILFIIAARSWLSYMVFSISPTIGDFYEFGDGFGFLRLSSSI
jgi:hypothetical protein